MRSARRLSLAPLQPSDAHSLHRLVEALRRSAQDQRRALVGRVLCKTLAGVVQKIAFRLDRGDL